MANKLRIVLAQLNLRVGDIKGNLDQHIQAAETARDKFSADVIVFPELSITGYPPEDLLLRKDFINEANEAIQSLIAKVKNIYCVVGYPRPEQDKLYNSCALIHNGNILAHYSKKCLPNYGVFDECRYFTPGKAAAVAPIKGIPTGIIICEDIWTAGPAKAAAEQGARLLLVPNASPFEIDKHDRRFTELHKRATHNKMPIVYVSNVGGQDEIVFDGGSMVVNEKGEISQFAGFFNETLLPVEINLDEATITSSSGNPPAVIAKISSEEKIYNALVLGVRDYINQNHFPGALVGVSGGIDSALTLAIAVDALGKDRVQAVIMPSRFTADISMTDAAQLVKNLGVKSEIISIEPAYKSFLETLAPAFAGKKADVTEENVQARCRAIILMALSNKFGSLVLTTGNRSELAVGYCTLYGDMAGGFAVLKDISKTFVYALANYRNQKQAVIPQSIINRPPTAELAPNQKDEDSIPPYSVLDKILECYLDQGLGIEGTIAKGFDRQTVLKVVGLIHKSEYKRKQSPLGPRVHNKSFGKDWRYPVTDGFKG